MKKVTIHQTIKGIFIACICGSILSGIFILLNDYVLQKDVMIPDWWRGYTVGVVTALILKKFLKDSTKQREE